ncbi:putative transposase y4qJ [Sinorhizobium fredii HH103]|uniref:Transposase y4qJ n=1 Tax=Sinorhizobium fredii (strain HH103) TaxID=1117943 RepID=G9AAX5_SINF1|nr:putative transposase y4qJ [Sinorhizobium fredii HH103]
MLAAVGGRWIACRRRRFFLPVRVLSRLFLERLLAAQAAGGLRFFGVLEPLGDGNAMARALRPLRKKRWVVYAKPPFGSPERVLAYLGRYTHRVAIANSRLVSADDTGVTFRWRDYRHGNAPRSMTLAPHEFIRRFLLHCLPAGFHRIRHYGFLANGIRRARLAVIRRLLADAPPQRRRAEGSQSGHQRARFDPTVCPCCGGILRIIARLPRARAWPDTS